MRSRQRAVLDALERDGRVGIVVAGRPYHNDPGINHEILEELQKPGYPIFWQDALPLDADILERLFGAEVRAGDIESPLVIDDVWKNSYSEHTSRKVWAAKYHRPPSQPDRPGAVELQVRARCPDLFRRRGDHRNSGTPYFCFKDMDENKPAFGIHQDPHRDHRLFPGTLPGDPAAAVVP
jgi:hypothetical protein